MCGEGGLTGPPSSNMPTQILMCPILDRNALRLRLNFELLKVMTEIKFPVSFTPMDYVAGTGSSRRRWHWRCIGSYSHRRRKRKLL